MNIVIISGSPRQESLSNRIALHLHQQFSTNKNINTSLLDVRNYNLPLLQNVFSRVEDAPTHLQPLAKTMFEANAFIVVTPEYNGSFSAALQNLFDHFPKQSRKAFGIATGSVGAMGGMRSSQQLLLLVPALFGIASPHMLITPFMDKKFDENGNLLDNSFAPTIQKFIDEFLWLAEAVSK